MTAGFCPRCGKQAPAGRRFCPACGYPLAATTTQAAHARLPHGLPSPIAVAAGVLVLGGSLLPWLDLGGVSATAWRLSLLGVVLGRELSGGLPVGVLCVVVLVIGLPFVARRPLPAHTYFWLGAVCAIAAGIAAWRWYGTDPRLGVQTGLVLSGAGALALIIEDVRTTPGRRPPRPVGPVAPGFAPPPPGRPPARGRDARTVVPAVLVGLALAAVAYGVVRSSGLEPVAGPFAGPSPTPSQRTFTDTELGITIDVPAGWKESRRDAVASLYDPSSGNGTAEGATTGVQLELEDAPSGELATAVTTRLRGRADYSLVSSGSVNFGGRPAFRHEYELTVRGEKLHIVELFVQRPTRAGKVLRVAAYAATSVRDVAEPVLNAILASASISD
jgi:hypothetical protein